MQTKPMFDTGLMTPRELARRVRELRSRTGLTQVEFGERLGYSSSTISKCENYRESDGMIGTRIKIIEQVAGVEIEGPFYRPAEDGQE